MARYMILDLETENHRVQGRFANPFSPKNYVVARGWKFQGDPRCSWKYYKEPHREHASIPDDVTLIVGHNLKFDLLYEWAGEDLQRFLKRGGRIWCTQYAEYLINAQVQSSQQTAMDDIIEKYGGRRKIDAVKVQWEMGMLTSQIHEDLLIDYLVGTEDEDRNSGDIGNTELIFLGQIKKAKEQRQIPMIMSRMDGLLCTTEMEYNGLRIDAEEGVRRSKDLETLLEEKTQELQSYIPELPDGLTFNWASRTHVSCLIFGGTIKYKKSAPYVDESTGQLARLKAKEPWPLFNGDPIDPKFTFLTPEGLRYKLDTGNVVLQDRFVSGAKKGDLKYKQMDVPGEIKTKIQDFFFTLPGYTKPDQKWKGAETDGAGKPLYSTAGEVIDELRLRNIPFIAALAARNDIIKDLGTYYIRYNPKKQDFVGMLTMLDPETNIIHHTLNHSRTITTRLSGSDPNMQNIPREGTSEVKKLFVSRFGADGLMLEADYSQLEVVVQGVLTGDVELCKDLRNRVDFHCKRVSAKFGCTYEEALKWCKDETDPHYKEWKPKRTGCKEFSFQRAYGAGAAAIALKTGMAIQDIQTMIEVEERMYPGVVKFNAAVEQEVKASAKAYRDGDKVRRLGFYRSPTATLYSFVSGDAPEWLAAKGITDTFSPTEMKNYPVQGFGGEIVQVILGKLYRHFRSNDNYGGKALLCNTVHDCVWIDVHKDVVQEVARDVKRIMESVPEVFKALHGLDITVPFPVEIEIGESLYTKHTIHIGEQ